MMIRPLRINNAQWYSLTSPAFCYYNNDHSTTAIMGLFFNWHARADSRKLFPAGWNVPADTEWVDLVNYLGGPSVARGKLKLPGLDYWRSTNTGTCNSSGFAAVSGGQRGIDGGRYWFLVWNYPTAIRYYDKKVDAFNIL